MKRYQVYEKVAEGLLPEASFAQWDEARKLVDQLITESPENSYVIGDSQWWLSHRTAPIVWRYVGRHSQ